jgi:hypothetical protein
MENNTWIAWGSRARDTEFGGRNFPCRIEEHAHSRRSPDLVSTAKVPIKTIANLLDQDFIQFDMQRCLPHSNFMYFNS